MFIEKGMSHGDKVTLHDKGDEAPGVLPADLQFIIQEKDHPVFKRKGADLLIEKELSLAESLCGYSFGITHLDGRVLHLSSSPGEVTPPNTLKCIEGEGMPVRGNAFETGRLFVLFKVTFPGSGELSEEAVVALESVLPARSMLEESEDAEVVSASVVDARSFGKISASDRSAVDSDSDEGMGGGRSVQCAQQ